MKVAFLKGTGLLDRLIQIWTFSKYSHCELIFSSGVSFGSSLKKPFKTEFGRKAYVDEYWDVYELDVPKDKEERIFTFCQSQVNKDYDWTAIIFSQILPFGIEDSDKWICSEICTASFQDAGYFIDKRASKVSPIGFYKLIEPIIKK